MRPLLVLFLLTASATSLAAPYQGRLFDTEQKAQWGCSGDEVVWVDPPTGRWFRKGNGWYEDTEDGGYACRRDVEGGARPAARKPPAPQQPGYEDE
ncbi:MAG: hypothetical protein JO267_10015 [Alphaproteobacteria bacterium]|nr:hypothetical protein [Alphaproteobacteria bacterium]MBV9862468.1 hypothetical protein [Alphaproteobacteria bacterium]